MKLKNLKTILIAMVVVCQVGTVAAQANGTFWIKLGVMMRRTPWTVGLGWNIVDDNGYAFKKIFDVKNSWNAPFYPSIARCEKYFDKGWSAVFNASFNQYKVGKWINDNKGSTSSSIFMSYDFNTKYDFTYLYDISDKWFHKLEKIVDVYATSGFGFTYRNTARVKSAATYNIGFGTTAILYDGWGINLEAMSKFGLKSPFFSTPSNYLQYTVGAVYRFKAGPGKIGRRHGLKKRYIINH